MRKIIEVVIPATCSVAPGSTWADEPTFKKSGAVIPALIRSTAMRLCEGLGNPCRVRVGPEVRFKKGRVQFLVVIDFKDDGVDIDIHALKNALEANFSGVLELENGVEDHVALSGNAVNVPEDRTPSATETAEFAERRNVELSANAAINAASKDEKESPDQVLVRMDLQSGDDLMHEEVVETCEKIVGASLVGQGFPLALIRSAAGSKAFPAGKNLSSEMVGVHIKAGDLRILEKVTITK